MSIYSLLIIAALIVLLIYAYYRNAQILKEMKQLIKVRETALDIANRVVNTSNSSDLYQRILESCLNLIPKAKFGSILMFNEEGLLTARASVGFNQDEISSFKLKPEESFLYIATKGKLDRTVIINRLEDIVLDWNIVNSGDKGFALRSEVSSPLYINQELVGMLCIDGDENDIFSEKDIYVLDYMSNQISTIIKNQKLYGEILSLSRYDSLTGLLNRNSFEFEAIKLLNPPRIDWNNTFFVLMDLDNLKQANDTFGHSYGDEMIRNFSLSVKNHLGKDEFCGRYGGDEFIAIFLCERSILSTRLEAIRSDFMRFKKTMQDTSFIPDFSYGIASFNEGSCSLDTLYKLTDGRMYEMKNRKKNII